MFDEHKLKSLLALKGLNVAKMCKLVHMSESNYYRKVKKDGKFTRAEMQRIGEIIGAENIKDVFFC